MSIIIIAISSRLAASDATSPGRSRVSIAYLFILLTIPIRPATGEEEPSSMPAILLFVSVAPGGGASPEDQFGKLSLGIIATVFPV
jgi:hypothetical protein